jgi:cysteine desulfurase/selenocysteine lyase
MTATANARRETAVADLDVARLRRDFPILARSVRGRPLVYLDNAATSQKPRAVIDCEARYYAEINANIHRGVHQLSQEATDAFEAARTRVQRFIGAAHREEIVFVRGTTEAINLVASSYGARLRAGDEILITELEHHSNIVPWQLLCERSGAILRVAPIDDRGALIPEAFERLLGDATRIVALAHVSNALGTINPVRELVGLAHARGAVVLVDGAQAVPHIEVDVQALDCDFYAFSAHKIYGPTGIGALYGKRALLEGMPPWQGGGDMIRSVAAIAAHERQLLDYATERAAEMPGLRLVGTAPQKAGVLSFILDGVHPHDVGTILDGEGIAVRTGHHCAMPVMDRFHVPATVRASFAMYNTHEEVDALFGALVKVREIFA